MAHSMFRGKTFVWHHLSRPTAKDFSALKKLVAIEAVDVVDIAEGTHLSKMVEYKHHTVLHLHLPAMGKGSAHTGKSHVVVILGDDILVTVSLAGNLPVDDVFDRAEANATFRRAVFLHSTASLLYVILVESYRVIERLLEKYAREADRIELRLEERRANAITSAIGRARRDILALELMLEPQQAMLARLYDVLRPRVPSTLATEIGNIRDEVSGMRVVARNLRDVIDGLFTMHDTLVSHRTNQIVEFLTVLSVLLMPPTLVTSYYGMNVANLPWAHSIVIVTAIVTSALLAFAIIILRLFRRP